MKISLNLMIYNEPMDIIRRCLDSVVDLVDEIIVYRDIEWSDNALIEEYDITLIKSVNLADSIVEQYRNLMLDDSNYDWVLILDPDEYLNEEARVYIKELRRYMFDIPPRVSGCIFNRKNIEYNENRELVYDNNYPDQQIRMLGPGMRYSGRIHEPPILPHGSFLMKMRGDIIHDKSHETYKEWYRKLLLYRSKGGHDDVKL